MRIYLDMCSLQRPFDDQRQFRVLIEADAVMEIIALCQSGLAELASSDALDYENERNPHPDRQDHIRKILERADCHVEFTPEVVVRAKSFEAAGIKPFDALHLACAVQSGADYFCTCDDRLLKRARAIQPGPPKAVSPLELIAEIGS